MKPSSKALSNAYQTMLASEAVLRRDWDRPEEDEAWADLHPEHPAETQESTEAEWLNAAARNPAFASLYESSENIYTLADGNPSSATKHDPEPALNQRLRRLFGFK